VGNSDENIDTFVQPLIETTAPPAPAAHRAWSVVPSPNAVAGGTTTCAAPPGLVPPSASPAAARGPAPWSSPGTAGPGRSSRAR
jgi:hypothetical protein